MRTTVELFDGFKASKKEVKKAFPLAEPFLEKTLESYNKLIDDIENSIYFNDIDTISDSIDEHKGTIKELMDEIEYCKNNPTDILHNFEPKNKKKPKFRRYAKNKRTMVIFDKYRII